VWRCGVLCPREGKTRFWLPRKKKIGEPPRPLNWPLTPLQPVLGLSTGTFPPPRVFSWPVDEKGTPLFYNWSPLATRVDRPPPKISREEPRNIPPHGKRRTKDLSCFSPVPDPTCKNQHRKSGVGLGKIPCGNWGARSQPSPSGIDFFRAWQ